MFYMIFGNLNNRGKVPPRQVITERLYNRRCCLLCAFCGKKSRKKQIVSPVCRRALGAYQPVKVEHEALLDVLFGWLAAAPVLTRLEVGELGVRVVQNGRCWVRNFAAAEKREVC